MNYSGKTFLRKLPSLLYQDTIGEPAMIYHLLGSSLFQIISSHTKAMQQ